MIRQKLVARSVLVLSLAMVSSAAWAQSAIVGVVTDTTGAVLPGVTVEARSPALIEQVKSAVTDGQGRYRIVDLRPGPYTVTSSLSGFKTVVRQGIALPADFTATVNVQLSVGAIEETITVSGAAPVVDVQSTQARQLVTREMADVLPTGRSYQNIAVTIPAISGTANVGGTNNTSFTATDLRAYSLGDAQQTVDGLALSPMGGGNHIKMNAGDFQEFSYVISGGAAEQAYAGIQLNLVPKAGGNTFSGIQGAFWSHPSLASTNASAEQIANGLGSVPELHQLNDYSFSLGGPVRRDRLWFYTSYRTWTAENKLAMLHDGKLGPKFPAGSSVVDDGGIHNITGRVTWQVSPRNKVAVSYAPTFVWRQFTAIETLGSRPEAQTRQLKTPTYSGQVKWTSTISNRLLAEAGVAPNTLGAILRQQLSVRGPAEFPPYGDVHKSDLATQLGYNGNLVDEDRFWYRTYYMGSLTYVTGSHALKTGAQFDNGNQVFTTDGPHGALTQQYQRGVPFGVTLYNLPLYTRTNFKSLGLYVQDSWRLKRLTINPGVRWDHYVAGFPEQTAAAGWWVPERTFPADPDLTKWSDASLRFGMSYDVFGTGRTAVKGSVGRYPSQETAFPNRYNPMVMQGDARNWADRDLQGRSLPTNGDDIAQPNEIGPSRNPAWGIRRNRNPDPDLQRSSNLMYHLALEHQLRPDLGVAVGYNRRELKDPIWTDNLTNVPEDYQLLGVADPRGNGQTLPVYQLLPSRIGPVNELDMNSTNTLTYDGVDVSVQGRLSNGAFFSGGTSTGRIVNETCQVENLNSLRFCDQSQFDIPFRTTFKMSASYPLPWLGFRLSAVYQSIAAPERTLNYVVTRAQLPQLQTVSSVTVRLNEPGSEYLDRINQVDLTAAGTVKAGRFRVRPEVALFNLFNTNTVLTETSTWPTRRPRTILSGRMIRLGAQMDF